LAGGQLTHPLVAVAVAAAGAAVLVAEGLGSGWRFIDWCGTTVVVLLVTVAFTAIAAGNHSRK